ncbi:MAG: ABC transporter permease [Bacteroidaceae bacterium]|nr:ABC transporter permease [Bacteroidaceae bacterium]
MNIIYEKLCDVCAVWRDEMKTFVRDEGVFLFCLLMPAVYPLLYAWIYNNEVIREVPVAVVDESHSALSREFIQKADAAPDVSVAYRAASLDEARRMVERQEVRGIYYLPAELADAVYEGRRTFVSVYADMAMTLQYKAIYMTATSVVGQMNKDIRISRMTKLTTQRDEDISAAPLRFEEVPIFNPSGGYAGFILPCVLMLVLQQTLMLGIGLSEGTRRERRRMLTVAHLHPSHGYGLRLALGKGLAYFMVYSVWAAYLSIVVPRLFGLVMIAQWRDLLAIMFPYLLACISFGLMLSWMVRYRENVLLLVVFTSVPFLFLSGVSWPLSSIPVFWQKVGALIPSTFAIRAYVRVGSMGATAADVMPELRALWIQAAAYFLVASVVMWRTRK